jgi:2-haloacid dehalogenase
MAVRALVFDVFGTLVDWRSGVAAAFRDEGVAGDPEALADAWRARYAPILGEVIGGARPWALLDELHHATLDDLLAEQGIEADLQQRERLVQSWHRLDPWPDVRAGLEALRLEYILATLSNAHVAMLVDLARHGDLHFDTLLSAELARAYKPAPEAYLTAARLLGLEPAQVMLVASHPLDLAGGRHAGLRSAFIDRPLEFGPGSPPREDPEADVSAPDLLALADAM